MTVRRVRPVPIEKHGLLKRGAPVPPEYRAWYQMVYRCTNPKFDQWKDYGGRGIKVCDSWRYSFTTFLKDMGPRPSAKHSIDRIDNAKGYEPSNCRWATREEQNGNMRTSVRLTHDGRTQCVSAWAREMGLSATTLVARLRNGWSVERALTAPANRRVSRCA
jgi:hypothetical protein